MPKSVGAAGGIAALLRPYRRRLALAMAGVAVNAAAWLILGQGLRFAVDEGLVNGGVDILDTALAGLAALACILAAGAFARAYLFNWIGERVAADLRNAAYRRLLTQDVAFFEAARTGELVARLSGDTSILQSTAGLTLSLASRHGAIVMGAAAMMLVTDPGLGAIALAGVPILGAGLWAGGRAVRALAGRTRTHLADLAGLAGESLDAVRTVKAAAREEAECALFAERSESAFAAARKHILARSLLISASAAATLLFLATVVWWGGRLVVIGAMSLGDLASFLFYAVMMASAASGLSEVGGHLASLRGALERLLAITSLPVAAPSQSAPALALPDPAHGAVEFRNVSFRYPSRPETPVLQDVSLALSPGETMAVVGHSGAGKSTLFALILRFYDPECGTITFDGVDATRVDTIDLRRRISVVPQEPVIFSATARDNIRYARPNASDDAVHSAAEAANALDFLEGLPQGLDTPLGQKGVRLSGGQRQRIAIARALLTDPALLLLDEATSALDARSERAVQEALARLTKGRTTLVIAHRLSTVLGADRIAVLDQGRLVATGTHASLSRDCPLYADLAALQFLDGAATKD